MRKDHSMRAVLLMFFAIFVFSAMFSAVDAFASMDPYYVDVQATVRIKVCGNNIKEADEQCDGTDLASQTCVTRGYGSGTLTCNAACTFNESGCVSAPAGGGGGGGVFISSPPETSVIFSGKAYPLSTVTLLKDAQVVATTTTTSDASFQITVGNLSSGTYIFSFYSEDKTGKRSNLLAFPISVVAGTITHVSSIFIAPTIDTNVERIKRGDTLSIFGQSAPNASVNITVSSDEEHFYKVTADKNGAYIYHLDTSILELGDHWAKSKASLRDIISGYSYVIKFDVLDKEVTELPRGALRGDLNGDRKVNLVDFSIAAFWYKRPLSPEFAKIEKERLNGDGKIDLVDFSIMAYYWTG